MKFRSCTIMFYFNQEEFKYTNKILNMMKLKHLKFFVEQKR